MTTIYLEEITSDDEGPPTEHNGEEVEVLAPCELPVHTLTADMVAASKAAQAAAPAPAPPAAAAEAELLRLQGNKAFGAKKFEDALGLYSDAIALDGDNGLLYGNRSAALLQLGRAEQAVGDAEKMVRLLPETAKAHFRLGSALSASGKPADAARALLDALRLDQSSEAIADALRRELARPALKKNHAHASLVQACQKELTLRGSSNGSNSGGASSRMRMAWQASQAKANAAVPPSRGGATLSAAAGRLWLIGGADRLGNVHADVWEYAPSTGDSKGGDGWRVHSTSSAGFTARSGHAAAAIPSPRDAAATASGARIVVFGGQDPRSSVLHNDVCILAVPGATAADGDGGDATWDEGQPAPHGQPPSARNGHSLSADTAEQALIVFGGADSDDHLNDVHRLAFGGATVSATDSAGSGGADAAPWEWSAPQCVGPPPRAREMHVAAVAPARRLLLVHGGKGGDDILSDVCVLDLIKWSWAPPIPSSCTRVGHALAQLPPPKDSAAAEGGGGTQRDGPILLFGGFSGSGFCNDTCRMQCPPAGGSLPSTFEVVEHVPSGGAPEKRFAHCATALDEVCFVFGGSAAASDLNDLFEGSYA